MTEQPMSFVDRCLVEFPAAQIGKLPRINCYDCSKADGKVCNKHQKTTCATCKQYMTPAHMHIDFVGHAQLTARLLELDPDWTWEPFAFDAQGAPLITVRGKTAEMWIRLTIDGVTRIGVGTADNNKPDVAKELIGDALRNAAMRFGIALHLWAKGELDGAFDEPAEPAPAEPTEKPTPTEKPATNGSKPAAGKAKPAGKPPAKPATKPAAKPTGDEKDPTKLFSKVPKPKRQSLMAALMENPMDSDEGTVPMWPFPTTKTLGESGEPLSPEVLAAAVEEATDMIHIWAANEGISLG